MPNHVTNELIAAKHILDSLRSPDRELDFEIVVPMPEILKGEPHSGITSWAEIAMGVVNLKTLSLPTPDPVEAFKNGDYGAASQRLQQGNAIRQMREGPFPIDWTDEEFEQLIKCMRGLKEHGFTSWYEWSIANWGTKWNAYEIQRISDTVLRFQTAWSAPLRWLEKLVEKFPNEEVTIRWADEDFGSNTGAITVKADGNVIDSRLKNDSADAHVLAMELLHGNVVPKDMKIGGDGRYSYADD